MLNAEDFQAEAVDEIVAETRIWGQKTTVILCIELDEDEDNEPCYIAKAMEFVRKNMDIINESISSAEDNREEILNRLFEESPVEMVQDYLNNIVNGAADGEYSSGDTISVKLPLSKDDFIEKLLVLEALTIEIDASDEEDEPEIGMTVSFGVKGGIAGGHGWDIEV